MIVTDDCEPQGQDGGDCAADERGRAVVGDELACEAEFTAMMDMTGEKAG